MSLIDEIRENAKNGTIGPWVVGPVDDTRVEGPDGAEVAQIDGDYNQPDTWPTMEANARRIAAVPRMEAALLAAANLEAQLVNCLEVLSEPDDRLCCDGNMCGCQGATAHQEARYYASEALAIFREACK